MNIIVYGASVSGQRVDRRTSEISGYYLWLNDELQRLDKSIQLHSVTAGSSGFKSGYALLPEVMQHNPNLIIFDWHSTYESKFDTEIWENTILCLVKNNIKILICIFPQRDLVNKPPRKNIHQAYASKKRHNKHIEILDFYRIKEFSSTIHLRDNVHTNSIGAEFYSKHIISKLKSSKILITVDKDTTNDLSHITPSIFSHVLQKNIKTKSFTVTGIKANQARNYMVFDMQIGSFSPVIAIYLNDRLIKTQSVWDKWCYYKRQIYYCVEWNVEVTEIDTLKCAVVAEDPNYKACKKQESEFSATFKNRYLEFKSIKFVGYKCENIEVKLSS